MRSAAQSLLFALAAAGCATGPPTGARPVGDQAAFRPYTRPAAPRAIPPPSRAAKIAAAPLPSASRERAVATARKLVGNTSMVVGGKRFPDDCTGLIRAAYSDGGVNVLAAARPGDNAVTAIYRYAQQHGRIYQGGWPVAGDLVFFKETYDVNRDGRRNDGLTHIGIVDEVEPDGTVTVIHRVSRGVVRYRMNLDHPGARTHPATGKRANDYLRAPGAGASLRLTGELFVAYAALLPAAEGLAHR